MTTISVLGSGSVEFGRSLVADLLTSPQLAGARLVLHDIDAERLDTSYRIARATAAAVGSDSVVEAAPELGAALDGADYVVNQINVGGFAATRLDFEIPHRHGVRQTISDTLGIGGIFRGLRTIPVVLGIAAEMQRRCPAAWLLNYTNPMTMVPWAVYETFPRAKVVGICHSVRDTQILLADIVGVPEQEIAFLTAGVNHQAFVLRFEHEGHDLYPRLREIVAGSPALQQKVKFEIFRRLGYVPTESSEHGAEYVPWFLPHPEMVDRHAIPIGAYLGWCQEGLDEYDEIRRRLDAGEDVTVEPGQELATSVIEALEGGPPRVLPGNLRNDGLIDNLLDDACVEVPCLVDRNGVQPTRIGALPPQLAAMNRAFLNVSELVVRAALDGSREHVYHAAMLDPSTSATLTLDAIVGLCDEMISAHGAALPEGVRDR
jgi:alpha-galactosidase